MPHQPIAHIQHRDGFAVSRHPLDPARADSLAEGSANALFLGDGYFRPFRGMTSQGASTGSRFMTQVGKTWGGLKDTGGGATQGKGSVFEDLGRSLWIIGAGQAHVAGTDVSGATASSLLKVVLMSSGVYGTPFTAGLAQPSAPDVGVSSSAGKVSNAVSCKIERRRPSTGARSLASPTSAVVVGQGNKIRVTFPAAATGQTHWRVYFTLQGFGGVGLHYLCSYSSSLDVTEAAVAAGTVDGVARSLEFDFQDGDLYPEEASFDDYPPPAGVFAFRLENVMHVVGCYADAVTSPTSTNTGTAIAVSKPNAYESYVPSHLLYLPEQVTAVLSRPQDSHAYVACENSIHAVSYVGYRGAELPATTITTVLPDSGVKYPHNWVQFRGRLCVYTAEGNLLLMRPGGEMDDSFAAPVQKFIQSWDPASTIVDYDPRTDSIVIGSGQILLAYCLKNGGWSAPIYLADYGLSGTVLASATAQRRLYITLNNGGAHTAYSFDVAAAAPVPLAFISSWQTAPGAALAKNLHEISSALETGSVSSPYALCVGTNLFPNYLRDAALTSGQPYVDSASARFDSTWLGKWLVVFGTNAGGSGVRFLMAQVLEIVSATRVRVGLYTDNDGTTANSNAGATLTGCLAFVGVWAASGTTNARTGAQFLPNYLPEVYNARCFSIAAWFLGEGDSGQLCHHTISGSVQGSTYAPIS